VHVRRTEAQLAGGCYSGDTARENNSVKGDGVPGDSCPTWKGSTRPGLAYSSWPWSSARLSNGGCGRILRERAPESEEGVKGEGERGMELDERPRTLHIHAGEARAWTCGGNAASMVKKLWCMAATQANPRARGGRRCDQGEMRFWAAYGPN
jgi:hypothetical protein